MTGRNNMNTTLANGIEWVGYIDWTVRDFHGYATDRGSSYNSYLIQDEKTTLIDAVKAPYAKNLLEKISAHARLSDLEYVVCNHAEPDHSGGLPLLTKSCPKLKVVCNAKCRDALSKHYDTADWEFKVIEDGETLSIGKRTL